MCKLSFISSGPATDRVSVLCQCAAEPDRQSQMGRARQAEPDRQSETGRAKQAEPDSQRETTAVERLRARERKAERERIENERGAEKQLRIPSAVDRCTGRGQTDACEGTSWLHLACYS